MLFSQKSHQVRTRSVGEVGVAEIAVEQVEQGLQPLDAERGVAAAGEPRLSFTKGGLGSVTPGAAATNFLPRVGVP